MIKYLFILILIGLAVPAFADTAEAPAATQPQYLFQLSYDDAEAAIGTALAEKGAGAKIAAVINGRKKDAMFSYSRPLTVEIRGLKFEPSPPRWSASLLFLSEGQVISALPAGGRYYEVVEAPVLKREVRNGDIIRESDIELRDFAVQQTGGGTITDLAELIGKSPLRSISAGRPIRSHEIAQPTVIKKNALVQMRYTSGPMEITTSGEAMSDGARGDVINVRNSASKKIIRAVVEDASTVSVVAAGGAYAAN